MADFTGPMAPATPTQKRILAEQAVTEPGSLRDVEIDKQRSQQSFGENFNAGLNTFEFGHKVQVSLNVTSNGI